MATNYKLRTDPHGVCIDVTKRRKDGKEGMTRKQWIRIENRLKPCPFCGQRVRLFRSDGGDCRMSRECRHGFYIKCMACDLLFGYEPNRGGVWCMEDIRALVCRWNERRGYTWRMTK